MSAQSPQPDNTPQPVAYDPQGRPLYLHPPVAPDKVGHQPVANQPSSHVTAVPNTIEGQNFNPQLRSQYANEPQVIHASRPLEPKPFVVSDELKRRNMEARLQYPHLNLSEGEYVILDIKRHPIGMIVPIAMTGVLVAAILLFSAIYPSIADASLTVMPSPTAIFGGALLFCVLVVLGGATVLWVYLQNQFYMTNESVIQEIQESLFSRHEQTVSLGSIEDASFRQAGILQTMFNYGTIRLSTEGDETTYIFSYVTNPKQQIAILNNAIESFKNGRPVDDYSASDDYN